jgi:predicted DNA binding CopG/RHH family protein
MKTNYDFSKAVKNPYAKRLKKQVTIRLNAQAIRYFQDMAEEMGMPYQSLIDLYLRDCAEKRRRLTLKWRESA